MPAAPPPEETIRIWSKLFPAMCKALMTPAATTIAVPCWSSWKTGIFMRSLQMRSTSKHSGALMSSRFTAPNVGSSAMTISASFFGSVSFTSMSKPSISANFLKSATLPSITGFDASAPILPRPSTAGPVRDHGDPVATPRVERRVGRVSVDLHARLGHARRIGQAQVARRRHRLGDADRELSGRVRRVIGQRRRLQCLFGHRSVVHACPPAGPVFRPRATFSPIALGEPSMIPVTVSSIRWASFTNGFAALPSRNAPS